MVGVQIINQFNNAGTFSQYLLTLIFQAIVSFWLFFIINTIIFGDHERIWTVVMIALTLLIIIGSIHMCIYDYPNPKHQRYEVIIDNNVKMKEFYQHYEIIKQEGEKFIVKEQAS